MKESSRFTKHSSKVDHPLWPKPNETAFIGLMHVEVIKGNAIVHKFSPGQWLDLMVKISEACPGYNCTVKQLQGKSNSLKFKWKKDHRLLISDTGFGWDDVNNLVMGSDECSVVGRVLGALVGGVRSISLQTFVLFEVFLKNKCIDDIEFESHIAALLYGIG